jgi:transcriptional regulator with PAS, ATPase and Fis domain
MHVGRSSKSLVPPQIQTASSQGSLVPQREGVYPALYLLLECDRPTAGSLRVSLRGRSRVEVGRGEHRHTARVNDAGVRLTVPDPWMSGCHAELVCALGEWTIRDAGSRNGVVKNGERVTHTTLLDGDVLEIGHTFFVFVAQEPEPAAEGTALGTLQTYHRELAAELAALAKLAPSHVCVMLSGQTGTGKEVVARAVHTASRRTGAFVALNCAAIPASLTESELFGHVRGAFTGAAESSSGVIRAADGGTLFLDEIAELSLAAQASLLRVLEASEVRPVGSAHAIPVDLRTITATHTKLAALTDAGRFRQDLLARLAGYSVELPSLRARRLDLGNICAELLTRFAPPGRTARLTRQAVRALIAHDWPHNIRGLAKALETGFVLAEGEIDVVHLPPDVRASTAHGVAPPALLTANETQHRDQLVVLLRQHKGNVAVVARELGKAAMQVRRWVRKYGIDLTSFRP